MQDFTLNDFSEFIRKEQKIVEDHFAQEMPTNEAHPARPKESSVQRILAYNKALAVRRSGTMDTMTFVLN